MDETCPELPQINVKIGDSIFTLYLEFYDSTGAYKNYYAIKTSSGFSIYCIYKNYTLFFIEIGEVNGIIRMHIDFFKRYTNINRDKIIPDEDFIFFISSLAYYFNVEITVINVSYITCDNINESKYCKSTIVRSFSSSGPQIKCYESSGTDNSLLKLDIKLYGGYYPMDFYDYLAYDNKRYKTSKLLGIEIQPRFSYKYLDILKIISPSKILNKEDRDDLYQTYEKVYKPIILQETSSFENFNSDKNNIKDFTVWIISNRCDLSVFLFDKMHRIYDDVNDNPFMNDYYILDHNTYLYNRNFISFYPTSINYSKIDIKKDIYKIKKEI